MSFPYNHNSRRRSSAYMVDINQMISNRSRFMRLVSNRDVKEALGNEQLGALTACHDLSWHFATDGNGRRHALRAIAVSPLEYTAAGASMKQLLRLPCSTIANLLLCQPDTGVFLVHLDSPNQLEDILYNIRRRNPPGRRRRSYPWPLLKLNIRLKGAPAEQSAICRRWQEVLYDITGIHRQARIVLQVTSEWVKFASLRQMVQGILPMGAPGSVKWYYQRMKWEGPSMLCDATDPHDYTSQMQVSSTHDPNSRLRTLNLAEWREQYVADILLGLSLPLEANVYSHAIQLWMHKHHYTTTRTAGPPRPGESKEVIRDLEDLPADALYVTTRPSEQHARLLTEYVSPWHLGSN